MSGAPATRKTALHVWCKTKTLGQAPTMYVASSLIGGAKETVKGAGEIGGDIFNSVFSPIWANVKYPVLIGGTAVLLILILK
jgi:hypothetical protein